MSPTSELPQRKDTPQMAEEILDEDEDKGSSGSHTEYETDSEFEPDSSEDDSKQPTAPRKYAPNARAEALRTSRAISSRINVKNDSESVSESASSSSKDDSATPPPRRMNTPQAEEAAIESEELQASGNGSELDQESSKPKPKGFGFRKPGPGRKRIYNRDENGKPIRFDADSSRIAPKQKYTYTNKIPRANKQRRDHAWRVDDSGEDEPLMNLHQAHQIEMAIQSELPEESGTVDEVQRQASDSESSTLSFLPHTPSLPSEEEAAEGIQEDSEAVEPETQQASEGETSILTPLSAALGGEIPGEAGALQATEVEASERSDSDLEEGELSEGIVEEDELNSPCGRHFADLRYEVCRQARAPDSHRHPHESQQTDTWVREKDGAPVPSYRHLHKKIQPRRKK